MKSSTQPTKAEQQRFDESVERTEQQAFDRSYKRARREIAKADGAAAGAAAAGVDAGNGLDGAGSSAIERARQRALGIQQPAKTGLQNPSSVPQKPSGRFIQRPDGSRVPEEFYSLDPESKARFEQLLKGEESEAANESLALQYSKSVGDQQASDARRITKLERLVESLIGENLELRRRQDNIDTSVEVAKSDALIEAESQLAQTIVNAGAVKAQLDSSTASSAREMEIQEADHRARFEASERVLGEMEGRLKSAGTLYQERGNAVVDQVAAIEGRVATAEVNQTEIDNGIKVNRDTLRAATGDDLKSVVDMNVKQAFDDRLEPAMEGLIARKYVTTAPTVGTDGYDPKRDDSAKPFLTEQVGDNATARAVNRALKKARRR